MKRYGFWIVRLVASLILLAWVLSQVQWHELVVSTAIIGLAVAGLFLVGILYIVDVWCVQALFPEMERTKGQQTILRARGESYAVAIWNYELGQATFGLRMAFLTQLARARVLARIGAVVYTDLALLLALGGLGGIVRGDDRWFVFAGSCLVVAALLLLLKEWGPRSTGRKRVAWWGKLVAAWEAFCVTPRRLVLMRLVYYGATLTYGVVGLALVGVETGVLTHLAVLPFVLLVNGLPISLSGLGTREASLLYLLQPENPAAVVSFSLAWSTAIIVGRGALGLWWQRHPAGEQPTPVGNGT